MRPKFLREGGFRIFRPQTAPKRRRPTENVPTAKTCRYDLRRVCVRRVLTCGFVFQAQRSAVEHSQVRPQPADVFQFLHGPEDRGAVVEE